MGSLNFPNYEEVEEGDKQIVDYVWEVKNAIRDFKEDSDEYDDILKIGSALDDITGGSFTFSELEIAINKYENLDEAEKEKLREIYGENEVYRQSAIEGILEGGEITSKDLLPAKKLISVDFVDYALGPKTFENKKIEEI